MTTLSERTPVQMGLMLGALGLVGTVFYQQGLINGRAPKDGEYVPAAVFKVTIESVDTKLSGLKESQDLRLQLVEKELARLRDDLARFAGERLNAPETR